MLYIIMVVVLQALITLTLLLYLIKNRESVLNMLLLYIGVVALDMGYELNPKAELQEITRRRER
ncbi:hypothetical protein [Chryseobacterium sp. c4a]|uniref:hypothetical protein n=1 Tax=Chryseobacterium sp. c4a TaxID=1573582 RepID=UPI00135BD391|nr:hypothetical protein [Chryseobacterium sp. c4a]